MERSTSRRLVRSTVASLACASGAVMTSAALVTRPERSPLLAAVTSGLAFASALFAVATAVEATMRHAPETSMDEMRDSLEKISRIAQAGALGDANAAQHAFALIARRTRESLDLLAQG